MVYLNNSISRRIIMISAQEQVRQIKHGVADLINEQDLVKK